jgi:hypothetical protein
MSLFFIPNKPDKKWELAAYLDVYKQKSLNSEEKKCVFIFPGNDTHHTKSTTLFSVKVGGGLAKIATDIGNADYPTLSLPTTSMEMWESDKTQQVIVQGAIQDLYRAVGAGYHLILPVREHTKESNYFDNPLNSAPGETQYEPNFWGGLQPGANKPLANHYIECLNNLQEFINLSEEERLEIIAANPQSTFYQAYVQGRQMTAEDSWFQKKPSASPASKPVSPPKPVLSDNRPHISKETRAAYEAIYQSGKEDVLASIRALLNDYTQNNSALWRFFTLHWNRNHVAKVNELVADIDKLIVNEDTVFERLDAIVRGNPFNPNGSLARRIDFLKEKNGILPLINNNDYYRPL